MTTTRKPPREQPNAPRPSPNDAQPDYPDERAPRDPDAASRKKAREVQATDGDPEALHTSNAVENLSTND